MLNNKRKGYICIVTIQMGLTRTAIRQKGKIESETAKVTTYLTGELKACFFTDCLEKEEMEQNVAKSILEIYYAILAVRPDLQGKSFEYIKKHLVARAALNFFNTKSA